METKLEITVQKTVEAITRIERFVIKYGHELTDDQKKRISKKIQELQNNLRKL